jgi:segregation and condensation protein A
LISVDGDNGGGPTAAIEVMDLAWEDDRPVRMPAAGAPAAGMPATPMLHLDGFDGPMDLLLDLVERQRIDLGRMSILILVEQFLAASDQLRDHVAIERRADWLVMATRLVLLRSRLLFPESPEAAKAAEQEAASALRRLDELVAMRAAAAWLGAQPILGETVFARGLPERTGLLLGTEHAVDVIAFLWASLSFFEDDAAEPDTVTRYRPSWSDLYSVTEAQDRILRILGDGGDGQELERFLPKPPAAAEAGGGDDPLRLYAAWATTFSASLELAKQGDVTLAQDANFADIYVSGLAAEPIEGRA